MNDSLGAAYGGAGGGRRIESTDAAHRVLPAERDAPRRDRKSDEGLEDQSGEARPTSPISAGDESMDVDRVEISEAARRALEEASKGSASTDDETVRP